MKDNKLTISNLNELIGEKFGNYSKYIIQERALPDLRDGLKPVQRRILFAMHTLRLNPNSPYKKSARVVGDVIGKYHPHGDTSVYEAMVRMGQEWKMNLPLVDMHGNKGSIDGDSPAAMRYTEARLGSISKYLIKNIDKEITNFSLNFDDSEKEPTVLPALFPNLFINGSMGIASGYSTNIAPHNFNEMLKALIFVLNNDDFTLKNLLKIIKGPDFPTGGIIVGEEQIIHAYKTGKGKITLRSKLEYNEKTNEIKIKEIPFETNKSEVISKIDALISQNKIPGILFIRDDSDRLGLEITIKIKSDAPVDAIKNYLFKNTDLQKNFYINQIAIKNKKPELLTLLDFFEGFKEFQIKTYRNLAKFELAKLQKKIEIVQALIIVIDVIDEVITMIRKSLNKADAKRKIMERFNFNDNQGEAIVTLRLYRLTSTDINELRIEFNELKKLISHFEKMLSDRNYLVEQIVLQLEEVQKEFDIKRKTEIQKEYEEIIINEEELVQEEKVNLSVTVNGYIKRTSIKSKDSSSKEAFGIRENDITIFNDIVSNLKTLFVFTSKGKYYSIPIYKLNEFKWKEVGAHISNYFSTLSEERIVSIKVVDKVVNDQEGFIISSTKNGLIKKSKISELETPSTKKGAKYSNLKTDDEISSLIFTYSEDEYIVSQSKFGFIVRYLSSEIPVTGLSSSGVKNINLIEKDEVVKTVVTNINDTDDGKEHIVVLTNTSKAKRFRASSVKQTSRGTKGTRILKASNVNKEYIINIFRVDEVEEIQVLFDDAELKELTLFKIVLLSDLTTGFSKFHSKKIVESIELVWKNVSSKSTKTVEVNLQSNSNENVENNDDFEQLDLDDILNNL